MRPLYFNLNCIGLVALLVSCPKKEQSADSLEQQVQSSISTKKAQLEDIAISGSLKFTSQVYMAFELIKKDPESELIVKDYINGIKEVERASGMDVYRKICYLTPMSANHSFEWCASIIIHEALHSSLYWNLCQNNARDLSPEFWTGQAAELACINAQIKFHERISGSKYLIAYLKNCNGMHFDLNRNGVFDNQDFELRDW